MTSSLNPMPFLRGVFKHMTEQTAADTEAALDKLPDTDGGTPATEETTGDAS